MREHLDLQSLGWTDDRSRHFHDTYGPIRPEADAGLVPARVSAQHRGGLRLRCARGELAAEISGRLRYEARGVLELPAVGDWVAATLHPGEADATVHAVLPRASSLVRRPPDDRGADAQVLAANVDLVWVVTSMNLDFNPRRIERTLALVREGGAAPVVVLTKGDLTDEPATFVARCHEVAPETPVEPVSAVTGEGMEALRGRLATGVTVALVGSSGAGKSTLVNALAGRPLVATGGIRTDDDRGRHTTTHRELHLLPDGGVVIDTPGLRELALFADDEGGIDAAFPEIDALVAQCRFGDCRHESEPGCAITAAIEEGRIDPGRVASWRKLKREAAHAARRRDARGRHEERRRGREFARMLRQRVDKRDRR